MIKFIKSIFKKETDDISVLGKQINKIYSTIPQDFGGGCSYEKALLMSLVISKFDLKKTLDIGVYRGRSFFPQAIAHKLYTNGVVFGVDPYNNEAAIQNDRPDLQVQLDRFIATTDFQELYDSVLRTIVNNNYESNCKLVREKSAVAAKGFEIDGVSFGMVHIDGNHDTKFVLDDVYCYLPLLEEKSFIVLDDISWSSVQPAFSILEKEMILIDKLVDSSNDFALFGKGLSNDELALARALFKKLN